MLSLITGILYPYILLTVLLTAVYLCGEAKNYPASLTVSWLDIAGIAVWLLIVINILIKEDGTNKSAQLADLLLYLLMYVAARCFFLHGHSAIRALLFVFTAIVFLEAVMGILQFSGMISRTNTLFLVTGTMANPAVYANFIITLLPGPLLLLFTSIRKWQRVTAGMIILLAVTALGLSEARTAWVALIVGMGCLFVLRSPENISRLSVILKRPVVRYVAVVLFLCVVGFAGKQLLQFKQDSTIGRWFVYKTTLRIIADHPFSGIGFDRFKIVFNDYQEQYFRQHPEDKAAARLASHVTVAYNEFLQTWSELGTVALLLLSGFLVKWLHIFNQLIRTSDILGQIVYAYGLSVFVLCCFSYPFRSSTLVINVLLLVAIMAWKDQQIVFSLKVNPPVVKVLRWMLFVPCLLLAASTLQYINHLGSWQTLTTIARRKGFERVEASYRQLYHQLENEPQFLYTYGTELCLHEKYKEAIPVLTKAALDFNYYDLYVRLGECYDRVGQKEAAERSYLKASFLVPNRFYPRYRLMKYYAANGASDKAVKWANTIIGMDIKIPSAQIDSIKLKASALIQLHGKG
ncbi:MAG: O-antigen ligase family protein [Chitinophaga sp.]|uniref:O-antigen ligase family protein n=1 Tax=Chitinophaga sp. TaxID=1869181 RepID=UPI001B0C06AC|nr:O-antigen ligase family protein [Chitinophaga sp.]MBO9729511.1 O-antigen ligase family protein [Chitinophaga sp.]